MDQFGVLVESIGFKAHGKSSAPLADLKSTNKANDNLNGFPRDIGINQSRSSYNSNTSFDAVDLDGFFKSDSRNDWKSPNSKLDDVFGGFAYGDSGFRASSSNNHYGDDLFGLMKTSSGSSSADHYDVLGNKVSPVMNTNPVDDLLGNFDAMGLKSNNTRGKQANASNYSDLIGNLNANVMKSSGVKKNVVKNQETASEPADLLSDFGVNSSPLNGRKSEANPVSQSAKSFSASAEDPFAMFDSPQGSSYKVNNGASGVDDYLDSLFSQSSRSNTRFDQSSTTEDSVYDDLFNNNVVPNKPKNKTSSMSSNNTRKASQKANSTNDYSYLFGMDVTLSSEEFKEIPDESEERRKARFKHYMATRARMDNALNEKNKRDLQAQQEQDEKHRVAATLDGDIKRWAAGKEGNLRALLSSLQHVLWAGSGWKPISLTDLITSTAVKKAYHKATLFVHPDKVQQKGASAKYIAEKVFDLLKEAWNKFNAEEFKKQ